MRGARSRRRSGATGSGRRSSAQVNQCVRRARKPSIGGLQILASGTRVFLELVGRQQRPGLEVPTRCVVMVHLRCAGGQEHLLAVRLRMGGDLAFGRKVQAPDFLHLGPSAEDKMPLAVGTVVDLHPQATV
jgi:hypothetical protein